MKEDLKKFDRDIVKFIAVIPMAIGHLIGALMSNGIIGYSQLTLVLSTLALIAPPVFFFFIAEGYRYTSSRKNYAKRLLLFALITQIPFSLLNYNSIFTFKELNIFFTLFLGLMSIVLWESGLPLPYRIIGVILIDGVTVLLGCEWQIFAVPMILVFHIFTDDPKRRFIWYLGLCIFHQFMYGGMSIYVFMSFGFILGIGCMLFAYALTTVFYSGEKGCHAKLSGQFFYVFYPAHLAVIYVIVPILKYILLVTAIGHFLTA